MKKIILSTLAVMLCSFGASADFVQINNQLHVVNPLNGKISVVRIGYATGEILPADMIVVKSANILQINNLLIAVSPEDGSTRVLTDLDGKTIPADSVKVKHTN